MIYILLIIVIVLIYVLFEINKMRNEIKDIKENMLTKHSFESPVQTYERVTGEKTK